MVQSFCKIIINIKYVTLAWHKLYDKTSDLTSVDTARKVLFTKKSRSIEHWTGQCCKEDTLGVKHLIQNPKFHVRPVGVGYGAMPCGHRTGLTFLRSWRQAGSWFIASTGKVVRQKPANAFLLHLDVGADANFALGIVYLELHAYYMELTYLLLIYLVLAELLDIIGQTPCLICKQ